MKVRCGFTNCKNNKMVGNGYFCQLKEVHIFGYYNSDEKEKGTQMKCENGSILNDRLERQDL
jgi:hypothetical protein